MADEQPMNVPEEPALTPEEEAEIEIRRQTDAMWFREGAVNDPFGYTLVYGVYSPSLGKRVRHTNTFEDVKDKKGKVVGREVRGRQTTVEAL